MPLWATSALIIQLFATWFIPPVTWGSRSIFFGDLWFFVWVLAGVAHLLGSKPSEVKQKVLSQLLKSGALILVIYIHGYFRPTLVMDLNQVGFTWNLRGSDSFQPLREGVVAARFISWFWGSILVTHWFSKETPARYSTAVNLTKLQVAAMLALALASVSMLLAWLSPTILNGFGNLYGYDPHAFPWSGRMYGVFRSPLEASMSLGLGVLLLQAFPLDARHKIFNQVSSALSILGVIASNALTPVIGWIAAGIFLMSSKKEKRSRYIAIATIFCTLSIGALVWTVQHNWALQKLNDLIYRFGPWGVYWNVALRRLDLFLFGFGFSEYHVDNIYVFLFNRGGALLFLAAMRWIAVSIRRRWNRWGWPEKTGVVYLLVTGLALDAWILRPVVAIWIATALPLLRTSNRSDASNHR